MSPEQEEYLTIVQTAAQSLLGLINDILDFSKIEAGRLAVAPVDFELRDLLSTTLRLFAEPAQKKGIELACAVGEDVSDWIHADADRLRQVVVNLVGNALKFTPSGEVVVEVSYEAGDSAILHFEVRDTGVGIPPQKQKQVFDSFAQADASTSRQYGGTGLGLAISARLVELMGGRIWLESVVGVGSTVHFTISAEPAERGPEPADLIVDSRHIEGARVLVVDDNATNRRILQATLAGFKMKTTMADGANAALDALTESWRSRQPYDMLLLDVQMPGVDGYELAEKIRRDSRFHSELMLMLSSSPSAGDAERCSQLGIAACLTKPIAREELRHAILEAIARHEGRESETARPERSSSPQAPARPLKILLAEDNRVNQKLAMRLLEKQGHSVEVVADGRSAVEAVERDRFDAILMDVQMPGMDGLAATSAIRESQGPSRRRTPIVALTAHAMQGDRERCLAAGMDAYLSKPIVSQELFETLASLVPV